MYFLQQMDFSCACFGTPLNSVPRLAGALELRVSTRFHARPIETIAGENLVSNHKALCISTTKEKKKLSVRNLGQKFYGLHFLGGMAWEKYENDAQLGQNYCLWCFNLGFYHFDLVEWGNDPEWSDTWRGADWRWNAQEVTWTWRKRINRKRG